MGKRSAVVELFLGDMGSMQRELRPSTQREDQLTMETKLEQIAVKAVNQLPKSVVREIRTPRSVGAGGGRPPPATRWDGKRGVGHRPQATAPILDTTKGDISKLKCYHRSFTSNEVALALKIRLSLSETQSCWQLISNRAMLLPYARSL